MLETIKKPEDIKKLSFKELSILASEVRQRIIEVTSVNGGHVASSLGATDFIVALLKVFNPLREQIIFDVGHQSYAYKILTERNDNFDTLRKYQGISGFPNASESIYDSFTVGHASTSISVALGFTIASEILQSPGMAIAVIGDGALTGGMAFEAINHAGHLHKNMIVILNDNKMSISQNIGALQNYLTNVLVSKSYNAIKKQVWDISQSLPDKMRTSFISGAQKIEESVMNIIVPNIFFEDLGFKYIGPIDGHDIPRMCRIFNKVKDNMTGPVLIHLVTQKGRGLDVAEKNQEKFHGIGPYDQDTGQIESNGEATWSKIFGDELVEIAKDNANIVAITAAMTDGTGLNAFATEYPQRFYDVGIAEQHAVTFAAGMAAKGLKPFVAIYSTFLQRAVDQIIHDVALPKLPVVFAIDRAGIVGEDGATHQGVFDISYLQFIPNIAIIAPSDSDDLRHAMQWVADYTDGPVAIRYPRGIVHTYPDKPEGVGEHFGYAQAHVWFTGSKIAISGVGHSFHIAHELYKMIKADHPHLSPYLINALFIKPYDHEVYDNVYATCDLHIVIEENATIGGFASKLMLDYNASECKTMPIGLPDAFIEHGEAGILRQMVGLTAESVRGKVSHQVIRG